MKPPSASNVLRETSPRNFLNAPSFFGSRFRNIRDPSPVDSIRSRSPSVKRKADNSLSYAGAAKKSLGFPHNDIFSKNLDSFEKIDLNVAKVETVCVKISQMITDLTDHKLLAIFNDLLGAVSAIADSQAEFAMILKSGGPIPKPSEGREQPSTQVFTQPPRYRPYTMHRC